MAKRRHYVRDRYGRFARTGIRGGVVLTAVKGKRKKIISKSAMTTRFTTGGLRRAGKFGPGVKSIRELAIGSGMRRRGQTVRSIERVNRVVIVPTPKVRRSRPVRRRYR